MTRRTSTFFPRLVAGVTVLAVAGAGLLAGGAANAQTPQPPPSGTIAFTPPEGTDLTVVNGVTSGPCDVPGSNAYNVVVTGPGAFAPNPDLGRPDGVNFAGTQDFGFSTTSPINFSARLFFRDLAHEVGTELQPGDYVVTFRCVDELFQTVFQTYRSTITFTTPTSYTTSGPTPAPTPVTPTPTPRATPAPTPRATPTLTRTDLTVVPNPVPAGLPVVLFATIAPNNAAGTVQFKAGNTNIGGPMPVTGGFAFSLTVLAQGQRTVAAVFTPNNPARFGSSSDSEQVMVRRLF